MQRIVMRNNGLFALVDDEDYLSLVNMGDWYMKSNGYACIKGKQKKGIRKPDEYMHGIIGSWMGFQIQVDHEDRNRLNNQRWNLRDTTQAQNMMNLGISSLNNTGYKGVTQTRYGTFAASIRVKGTRHWLGSFLTLQEAILARRSAEMVYHGEYSNNGG